MKAIKNKETSETFIKPKDGRGGARIGSGRKSTGFKTTTMRVDVRMKGLIEMIKSKLTSGAMNENDLKRFEELAANEAQGLKA